MSCETPTPRVFMFERRGKKEGEDHAAVASLTTPKITKGSQFIDLRDAHGNVIATLSWPTWIIVREI